MSEDIQTPEAEDEDGLIEYMFTNDLTSVQRLRPLLHMFYKGVFTNTIGIMNALNTETDEEELILVGVEHTEDGRTLTYPIASILDNTLASKYVGPDGRGGWLIDEDAEEATDGGTAIN